MKMDSEIAFVKEQILAQDRTCDLPLTGRLLYRLSYDG
jgi:hypothetical protein